ncbi:MAG: Extradiol ring-cleavage dioxygenase class protein subunit [Candidatus Eremiobacteraeota bacterium]|nr:Extradiol ring-cleavage dioxygenase class protein subunit [Candidatus Eremiobacteraeota bacterium]
MGDILGLGVSHYPPYSGYDDNMAGILGYTLNDPDIPDAVKDPAAWPEPMRRQWGDDNGKAAAAQHRAAIERGFRTVREALDDFKPDFVLIWGDDQYENFREDIIPAFCVMAYPTRELHPWEKMSTSIAGKPNYWNEPKETTRIVHGHPDAAKMLVGGLIDEEFDVAYAYEPLHFKGLPHAFLNAILYLDFERTGFPYPVVPMQVNCYGRRVISYQGSFSRFADAGRPEDPPSPSPRRCFELGRAVARVLARSPYRVAVIASSSWSHAFMVDKTWRLNPDIGGDRALYDRLVAGDLTHWREMTRAQIEDSGQQEVLNWFPLMGAMHELGCKLRWSDFVETHIFNSNKVAAVFEPWLASGAVSAPREAALSG